VAILSENRLEWSISDFAIQFAGGVTVPIYPTLITPQVEYILKDADVRAVFVSTKIQAAKVAALRANLPLLEHVIAFDDDAAGSGARSFRELVERGRALTSTKTAADMAGEVSPTDWASIVYTSGTTGEPKGVILTHRNFMSNVRMNLDAFNIGTNDVYLSVLPLSHVFERLVGYVMTTAGVPISYSESIETAMANLKEIRPTIVCFVPRIFEKFYDAIHKMVDDGSSARRGMFNWAVKVGTRASLRARGRRLSPLTTAAAQDRAHARVQEDPRPRGRARALLHLRKRAARAQHHRVLPRRRSSRAGRLRTHRDSARRHREHARTFSLRHRGTAAQGAKKCVSKRTARSSCAAPT
jgi:long-chain acyl-CoA synthetase